MHANLDGTIVIPQDRANRSGKMTATASQQGPGASQTSTAKNNTNRQRLPCCLAHPSTLPETNYIPQSQMDILVPGLPRHNTFVWGEKNQVDGHIKAKKGLIDWVGTSKDYKNVRAADKLQLASSSWALARAWASETRFEWRFLAIHWRGRLHTWGAMLWHGGPRPARWRRPHPGRERRV